ncbi:CDP-glucose 4,6-dehydratase [Paenibacillus ginsengihumi]|uniref:CDP-glucose 4,6-dehydratase n=1 Tax=Paenibacillus ginsengihumi TaxID=431596 RepID=UPI000370DE72|nr:CDP-glucose 4,6-dehydratase [Paenibacillus ginsengihumi]
MIDRQFWQGKRVFVTGHTGFKGSWLSMWLHSLGAVLTGYSLAPPTRPSLFEAGRVGGCTRTVTGDVRQLERLVRTMDEANPDIVIHMAAQPLVRTGYRMPVQTYETNVMGTVHLFEAVRIVANGKRRIKAVVHVTTDKCYENQEWPWGYRESDPLGGHDPYSSSKACSELIAACYRSSYFSPAAHASHGVAVASARAGNVIGGGDWAADRLLPDCLRALACGEPIELRHPGATRPWQHVLEPLSGYLLLAQRLYEEGPAYSGGWNFGPDDQDVQPVESVVRKVCEMWGAGTAYSVQPGEHPPEAHALKLDCSKAKSELGWSPRWRLDQAIRKTVEWTKAYQAGQDARELCLAQIAEYDA